MNPCPKLRLQRITKRYGNGVLANDDVSFDVPAASIHAIVGENGAGKSTVLKLLYGLEQADAGTLWLDGQVRRFMRPAQAMAAGIGLVPQHLQLLPSLTVAENIVLGSEPTRFGWLDAAAACRQVQVLAKQYGLAVQPEAPVHTLAAGEQQRVAILKALRRGVGLLLLDEPSALLTPPETQAMFASLRALVRAGLTVVLITHKTAEVREVCDSFTVMRAGRVVGGGRTADVGARQMAELIVGRTLQGAAVTRVDARGRPARVQVRGLTLVRATGRPELQRVSFDVAGGEILGIAGVEGNGQNRLADILSGMQRASSGTATIDGQAFIDAGVPQARRLGVGCVPEDRLHAGVAPGMSVAENGVALDYRAPPMSRWGVLNLPRIAERARELIRRHGVRARDAAVPVGTLSGGNMQKVVVGRELLARPRLLIASQPTRGVDIGAAQSLRQAIVAQRDEGAAVLLVSADLEEVFEMSDRIAVLFEGRIVAHFLAGQASVSAVGRFMTGMGSCVDTHATLDAPLTVVEEARA